MVRAVESTCAPRRRSLGVLEGRVEIAGQRRAVDEWRHCLLNYAIVEVLVRTESR